MWLNASNESSKKCESIVVVVVGPSLVSLAPNQFWELESML